MHLIWYGLSCPFINMTDAKNDNDITLSIPYFPTSASHRSTPLLYLVDTMFKD